MTSAALQPARTAQPLMRHVDWIWRIRGRINLPPGQSADQALDRLAPVFDAVGTRHERTADALVFTKTDPASQDRLAVFDAGVLQVSNEGAGVLRYDLTSRILLACFIAPVMFVGFGQLTIYVGEREKAQAAAEAKTAKAKAKKPDTREFPRNPIDVALGAPAPKTKKEIAAEKEKKKKEPPDPTAAYVFAGIFAALYLIGRWLEARLARTLFRKALNGDA